MPLECLHAFILSDINVIRKYVANKIYSELLIPWHASFDEQMYYIIAIT